MEEITFVDSSTVTLANCMGDDLSVVKAAVVSTGLDASEWPTERVRGLISRLMADRHGAPFEHVVMTFMVKTPIFTARQLMRHRIASWNEASGRYRVLPATFYLPPETRLIKQVGKAMDYTFEEDHALSRAARDVIRSHSRRAYRAYETLLEAGVAREVARMILPTNLMTELTVTVNLRSLFNLLALRGTGEALFPSHPQHEITEVAAGMEQYVSLIAPASYEAFVEAKRVAP